jgi:hypothetical protein
MYLLLLILFHLAFKCPVLVNFTTRWSIITGATGRRLENYMLINNFLNYYFGIQCAHARPHYQPQSTNNVPPPLPITHGSL